MSLTKKVKTITAISASGIALYFLEGTGFMNNLQSPELVEINQAWVGDIAKVGMTYFSYFTRFAMDAVGAGLAGMITYKGVGGIESVVKSKRVKGLGFRDENYYNSEPPTLNLELIYSKLTRGNNNE